jgi:hypothetical protein
MGKTPHKPDDPEQYQRFLKLAEELEADSTPAQFDKAFRKVATAKRQPPTKPKRKKR